MFIDDILIIMLEEQKKSQFFSQEYLYKHYRLTAGPRQKRKSFEPKNMFFYFWGNSFYPYSKVVGSLYVCVSV